MPSTRTDSSERVGLNDHEITASQEDHTVILSNGGINSGDITLRSRYQYPWLRFSTVYIGFIIVETVVTVILWLTGGDSKYFIDNIAHYQLKQSVFDLALVSLLKCLLFLILIQQLEETVKKSFDISYNFVLRSRLKAFFALLFILSIAIFAFCVAKGGLILNEVLNKDNYPGMHETYYACVIWCIFTSLMNLILCSLSLILMGRLKESRMLKYYNQFNQEVDRDGKPVPQQVSLIRLVKLARPEFGLLALAGVMLLVSTGVQTIAPLYFGKVVDAALNSMEDLNKTVIILLFIYAVGSLAGLFRSWLFTLAGQRLVARLRTKLFSTVILQEIAFFDVSRTGELCNRLSSDTQVLQNAITVNVSMLFRFLLQILGSLILMFYLNASLTGVLLAVVPIVSLGAVQYGRFVRTLRKRFQDKLAEAGTKAEEALSSVRTVKSFSGEEKEINEYGEHIQGSYNIGKRLALAQGLMEGLLSVFAYGAICAVLWYGGKLVHDNKKDPSTGITSGLLTLLGGVLILFAEYGKLVSGVLIGQRLAFLLYTLQVAMGFAVLSSLYGDFMQALGASVRIFTLLDRKPDLYTCENPFVMPRFSGEMSFENVTFTYPSRPENKVLKDISFTVKPGEMVALVGPSGGGKSTIVSLIERFYDPNEGRITLDGLDLKTLDPVWYHNNIALVSQEPTLFACSIKENIAYGRGALDDEVKEAARLANAHDFISEFEEGYDTLVGERGVRLSGGQKQRVAIARALIMNPAILLLDEATSALDAESEHLVQEAIDRAMKARTVVIIAHRLSTVKNADKVIVIDKGRIAEMGTHSQLLDHDGVYKRLILRQLMTGKESKNSDDGSYYEDDRDDGMQNERESRTEDVSRGNDGITNLAATDDENKPLINL